MQQYTAVVITAPTDGSAVTAAAATSLLPGAAKYTMGTGFLFFAGQELCVEAAGRATTAASTPGTYTFDVRFGSVIVATTQAVSLATSQTNVTWRIKMNLTVRAIGSGTSANVLFTGELFGAAFTGSPIMLPASAPATGTGFDSSAAQQVDFFLTPSAATNSCTLHQFRLFSLN